MQIENIPLGKIQVPEKYRREKSQNLSRDQGFLTRSIRSVGLRFPITVRETGKSYVLVDGVLRYNAFKSMRSETIPSRVLPSSNRQDMDVVRFQLNFHRENLKPMDEARIIKAIMVEGGWTKQEVADALGKKVSALLRYLDCLNVNSKWQHLVNDRVIMLTDMQPIAALSHFGQKYLYEQIKKRDLPFSGATISSMTRAMDPVKHPEFFKNPKVVASGRINERHGHPFAMKKVESVARMRVVTDHRQKFLKKLEDEISLVIPIIQKAMETKEVWDDLPVRTKNCFKDFASEYIR